MNYTQALDYIHSNFWMGSKPGLSRTKDLLCRMGNPQDKLKFIHVAGTNGKGSFCAMLSSILNRAGLKTGTYTSPYILRFNERMKVCGKDIPDETLAQLTEYVRPFAEAMEEKPTEFELITAVAMEYFAREACDVVVLECGMGGRLDSTNIIKTPILSVITGIALDHTSFLGDSIPKIAAEKAGIIKNGVPCLWCGRDEAAKEVIAEKAKEMEAPLHLVNREGFTLHAAELSGTTFDYGSFRNMTLPLLGLYQTENVQNVFTAISILKDLGYDLTEDAIREGLGATAWPARYEIVSEKPLILCDGGHNPQGIDSAVESTKHYFKDKKLLIVTGVMADKDYTYMAKRLSEVGKEIFCLTPDNPRSLKGEKYAEVFRSLGVPANGYASPLEALQAAYHKALSENDAILCVGSLYMYGEIRAALTAIKTK